MICNMHLDNLSLLGVLAILLQFAIMGSVILRVILTRHPPGSAFAWILLTTILPYIGFFLYLMFGERPIGRLRRRRLREILTRWGRLAYHKISPVGPLPKLLMQHRSFIHLACKLGGMPIASGSRTQLLGSADKTIASLLQDICAAQSSIDMEFYIWDEGGDVESIAQALLAAATRGVRVRILVDDFGSRSFLRSKSKTSMEAAGIEIASALPMRFLRVFGLQRADIRLHRKTVIIDRRIAYTGSFNMIDPRRYQGAKEVGAWVDAMVRVEGPAVTALMAVWTFDWALQPDGDMSDFDDDFAEELIPNCGPASVVTVPSGPYENGDRSLLLVLEAINRAQYSLTITTPYFVPSEAVVMALHNAVLRGVDVKLIVPERADSLPVTYAMRRYFDDLLQGGVRILLYQGGLLHTKSITIDDECSVFGTLNIDNRSLHLNFELMMVIFDSAFTTDLDKLQAEYASRCRELNADTWRQRPLADRLKEGACFLASPIL